MEDLKVIPGVNLSPQETGERLEEIGNISLQGREHGQVYGQIMNSLLTPEMGDLVISCYQSPCGREVPGGVQPLTPERGPTLISNVLGQQMSPELALQEKNVTLRHLRKSGLKLDFEVTCPNLGCDACWLRDRE